MMPAADLAPTDLAPADLAPADLLQPYRAHLVKRPQLQHCQHCHAQVQLTEGGGRQPAAVSSSLQHVPHNACDPAHSSVSSSSSSSNSNSNSSMTAAADDEKTRTEPLVM